MVGVRAVAQGGGAAAAGATAGLAALVRVARLCDVAEPSGRKEEKQKGVNYAVLHATVVKRALGNTLLRHPARLVTQFSDRDGQKTRLGFWGGRKILPRVKKEDMGEADYDKADIWTLNFKHSSPPNHQS